LNATVANVVSLSDVLAIMTEYLATGLRSAHYDWDDVSRDWIDEAVTQKGTGITVIQPESKKGPAE